MAEKPAKEEKIEHPKEHYVFCSRTDHTRGIWPGDESKHLNVLFINRTFVINEANVKAVGGGFTIKEVVQALKDSDKNGNDIRLVVGPGEEISAETLAWQKDVMSGFKQFTGKQGAATA